MTRWGRAVLVGGVAAGAMLAAACGALGGGGDEDGPRVLQITAEQDGCTPTSLVAGAGERVTFEVTNGSGQDRELEGIEGTRVEEVLVPKGRTRSIPFTVPADAQVLKLKCYAPGGPSTIIDVQVVADATVGRAKTKQSASKAADAGSVAEEHTYETTKAPGATVEVRLDNYTVQPDRASAPAGPIRFRAANVHRTDLHELAVLRVRPDGSMENTGEVEDLAAGQSGEIVLDLPAGKYQLACLIAKGQAKSPVDHYQAGMYTAFEVR